MSSIIERLEEYIKTKGLNPRQFSLSIGRSAAYFSNTLHSGASPSSEILSLIVEKYPDIDIRYILSGKKTLQVVDSAQEPQGSYELQHKEQSLEDFLEKMIDRRIKKVLNENKH